MKQFKTVFKFELKGMMRNKSLMITTIVMCVILLIVTTIPTVFVLFGNDPDTATPGFQNPEVVDKFIVVYGNEELEKTLSPFLGEKTYSSEVELNKAISNKEVKSGFMINDYTNYTYISYDRGSDTMEQRIFEDILSRANEQRLFAQEGLDSVKIYKILEQPIEYNNVTLGKDAGSGVVIAFSVMFIMYMLILLYGTNVATAVAREKDSRTMELLITSTKPKTLILGKVAAAGTMGVLQVSAMIFVAVIGFMLNKVNYPDFILDMIQGSMTMDTTVVYVLFSILGYILYLFIYASLGSLVSKVEDVNSAVAPVTFLFVFAYLSANFAIQSPDNTFVKVTSFIPFVSLFTMPIRYMFTSVPLLSILASSAIMVVTVVLLAALSIYIYRFGSLNYGNRIKLKDIVKSFKR